MPPVSSGSPPRCIPLTVLARRFWNELAPKLTKEGILTELDEYELAHLCTAMALQQEEHFSTERWRAIQASQAKFGLTPADRARISVAPKKPESKLSRFLRGPQKG